MKTKITCICLVLLSIGLINAQDQSSENTLIPKKTWSSIPEIKNLVDQAEGLLNQLKTNVITADDEHKKIAQDLYADLERAVIFEQKLNKKAPQAVIEKSEYLMMQLSNLFALETPIEKMQRDYEGAVSWLSSLWSTVHGHAKASLTTVIDLAQKGSSWALDKINYIASNLYQSMSIKSAVNLLEKFIGSSKTKEVIKAAYMQTQGKDFTDPSPEIQAIADEAIKNTGLDPEKVIILEDHGIGRDYNAYVYDELPYSFMVITSFKPCPCENLQSKTFSAYHEAGHIFYRHYTISNILHRGVPALLCAASLFAIYKADNVTKSVILLAGMIAIFLTENSEYFYGRPQEKEADLFACDQLIKHGKADVVKKVIENMQKSSMEHFEKMGWWQQIKSSAEHPSFPERVRYLKECLEDHGISIDVPNGPYKESCVACYRYLKENILHCTCGNSEGKTNKTQLDLAQCPPPLEINNCNGQLTCGACS